eukprot:TRINITY_DN28663_c0_g1_i1.p1 TRINITY_DN28663_c0_g1~~TRINITY_DN28663_c0_g1_i1.p1  ORF type:complete len:377 (+),score=47.90 TRINITY_DN28663_c0_g1_i1:80-1132(+)
MVDRAPSMPAMARRWNGDGQSIVHPHGRPSRARSASRPRWSSEARNTQRFSGASWMQQHTRCQAGYPKATHGTSPVGGGCFRYEGGALRVGPRDFRRGRREEYGLRRPREILGSDQSSHSHRDAARMVEVAERSVSTPVFSGDGSCCTRSKCKRCGIGPEPELADWGERHASDSTAVVGHASNRGRKDVDGEGLGYVEQNWATPPSSVADSAAVEDMAASTPSFIGGGFRPLAFASSEKPSSAAVRGGRCDVVKSLPTGGCHGNSWYGFSRCSTCGCSDGHCRDSVCGGFDYAMPPAGLQVEPRSPISAVGDMARVRHQASLQGSGGVASAMESWGAWRDWQEHPHLAVT